MLMMVNGVVLNVMWAVCRIAAVSIGLFNNIVRKKVSVV